MDPIEMFPAPGSRRVRHVGDTLAFSLRGPTQAAPSSGWQARLRTSLGRGAALRREIIDAHTYSVPPFGASWHDVPLAWNEARRLWSRDFVLAEAGFHAAKAYLIDPRGYQHWPSGPDFGVSVHPDWCRTANTLYCAFTRLFGATRSAARLLPESFEPVARELERHGFATLPPSGTFRDLTRQLPHIVGRLGCRILHLLPIHPTPTVHARFGRMGSPYAALDLTSVDPALVEFDQRTTGIEQFVELTRAAHGLGARVFLDIVINHTGWGSRLFEEHPEFFRREPDGRFACPGAWGVVWEDLVELEQHDPALWDLIADSLLVWCRRGVDGFRCDAGYKIPTHVWQYIIARVTLEFPDTVFLLEGLGGSWEATETLLGPGGMQWAYSELFQNYSGDQVQSYLDYALAQSERAGTYVHYSETHDNDRLAARGRAWSLLRNRLAALTSVRGGFGFTCGVEWLATEKIRVHQRTGLAWEALDHLVEEIATLNRILAHHPAFFDGASLRRLSPPGSTVFALERTSEDGLHRCLVLANTSLESPASLVLAPGSLPPGIPCHDLLGQPVPAIRTVEEGLEITLPACHAACLATMASSELDAAHGDAYRRFRAHLAFAIQSAAALIPSERLALSDPAAIAAAVEQSPARWLAALSANLEITHADSSAGGSLDLAQVARDATRPDLFLNVVEWRHADVRRLTQVPPGWWLLISDEAPFSAHLETPALPRPFHRRSIPSHAGQVAWFPPHPPGASHVGALQMERNGPTPGTSNARLLFLADSPDRNASPTLPEPPRPDALALLTNGRGGMARLRVDFGTVRSKYDCALAANLHPSVPVDRHVFVKRVRAWLNADGFISPLDRINLHAFSPGPPATWTFRPNAGDGRTVTLSVTADMPEGRNATRFTFSRAADDQPLPVSLTLRADVEDRSFHSETRRTPGADDHFHRHTHTCSQGIGFDFTPAPERQLRVRADRGTYHAQPEWSEHVPHPIEGTRGQTAAGDAFSPGWFEIPLPPGAQVVLTLDADPSQAAAPLATTESRTDHSGPSDPFARRLQDAARHFVVRRGDGCTVIAGYPWFLDWGRDTLIAARGLLATRHAPDVVRILETFGRFADRGTLPNSIHGENASNRDTSDAPLWYAIVLEEAVDRFGPDVLRQPARPGGPTLLQVVRSLAEGYLAGTPNGIRVDPSSNLVWSPSHFTWMDTNHPAGTPREGYPIEIQALWLRTLRLLARYDRAHAESWEALARQTHGALQSRYWLPDRGWFSDVLLAPAGTAASSAIPDTALRPNQYLSIAFGFTPVDHGRAAVQAGLRHLVVPGAIRSLAPLPVSPPLVIRAADGHPLNDPVHPYWGRYEGDEDTRRKPAYHNGTAWSWLLPAFCEAMAVAWDWNPAAVRAARALLLANDALLDRDCLGHLPEIFDGDAPHLPRGCDAQAWSITETLRVWNRLQSPPSPLSHAPKA